MSWSNFKCNAVLPKSVICYGISSVIRSPHYKTEAMIVQFVRLKSPLTEDDLLEIAHDRAPQFRAIKGLLQKYYVRLPEPCTYGGIYIWDSVESLQQFKDSELASTIGSSYQVSEPPTVELMNLLFSLRE